MINLNQFSRGTENYYKHFLGGVYTDGMKHVCETCGSYWLMDVVFSHRNTMRSFLTLDSFPVVVHFRKYKTTTGGKVIVSYYDNEGEKIEKTLQAIQSTDFPFEQFKDNQFSFLLGYDYERKNLILSLLEED